MLGIGLVCADRIHAISKTNDQLADSRVYRTYALAERANHHNHDARSEWENQCRLNNLRLDYSKLAQTGVWPCSNSPVHSVQ